MKKSIRLFSLLTLCFLLAGCGKQESTSQSSPPPASSASPGSPSIATATPPGTAPAAAFRQTSFQAVTSQLDGGGTIFGYLSLDQWLKGLSAKVSELRQLALELPNVPESERTMINQAFDLARGLIKASGIESLDGVGMSGIQLGPETFRTKTILHHPEGGGDGLFWTAFGKQAHELESLKLLPSNTGFAAFSDLDVAGIWNLLEQELSKSGIAPVVEGIKGWPAMFEEQSGLNWSQALASLGGEFGFILTLDETRKVQIPAGTTPTEIAEPALALVVRIKNDLLYDRITRELKDNPSVTIVEEAGLKMASMPIPLPVPIPLQATVASSGDYLFVSSSSNLVRSALAVRKGEATGVKDTPGFKALARHLTLTGNMVSYTDKRVGQAIMDIQKQLMTAQNLPKEQTELMQKLFLSQPPAEGLAVSSHTSSGWISVAVGNQDASLVALAAPAAVVAIAAGMTLPALAKAKTKAQTISSVSNVKQIALAARMYSNDHDDKFPPAESWCDALAKDYSLPEKVFKAPGDTSPNRSSYAYNTRLAGRDEGQINPQTVVFFECDGGWNKHGGKELLRSRPQQGNLYVFGFADGSVRQVPVSEVPSLRWDP